MQSKRTLATEFQMIETLKTLATAYEQISVMRIQRVRGSVLTTRDFLSGLAEIFRDVKQSYKEEIAKLIKHKKNNKVTLSGLTKNGKTVAILLSANNKLYGDIIARVFNLFMQDIKSNLNYDIVIIGKIGKAMFDQRETGRKYTYFDLPDEGAKLSDVSPILKYAVVYEKILVYYGRFVNIISQEPAVSEVSGEESLINEPIEEEKPRDAAPYFFEPNLQKIMGFFEDQVFASILKQVVDESELSRLASRIKSMEDSLGMIEKEESTLLKTANRMRRMTEDTKQIQRLSGIALWQGK